MSIRPRGLGNEFTLTRLAFIVAALGAGTMGFAIQRGATWTVAAVGEIVGQRSFRRLVALLEAALWVGRGLVVAQALDVLQRCPKATR